MAQGATVILGLLLLLADAGASSYVGSAACTGCHREIAKVYAATGMGQSVRPASELSGIPEDATVTGAGGRQVRVFRDARGWHQSEQEPGIFTDQQDLVCVFGSGANGLTPVVRRGDELFQAPLSYYSKTKKWGLSPGYEVADYGFSRPIAEACGGCHSSGKTAPIGCESCHGPGAAHVRWQGKRGITNPAKLAPRLAEEICLNCHQGGDARVARAGKQAEDFRPGQWLVDTVAIFELPAKGEADLLDHHAAMKRSRCFRESRGKLSCLTCHDPHQEPARADAATYYRKKCLTCHSETSCQLPAAARTDDCVSCHMPKRDVAVISHTALTNHRIPARAGDAPAPSSPAEWTGLRLVNPKPGQTALPEVTLFRAYLQVADGHPDLQDKYGELLERLRVSQSDDALVQAALGHRALQTGKNEEALVYFEKAQKEPTPALYQDQAQALVRLGRSDEASHLLERAVALNPFDATLQKALTLQYINLKQYSDARRVMEHYVVLFPEDTFMRQLLKKVSP